MQRQSSADLARTTFGVLVIGLLLATSLWVLRPFLGPAIWAVMVVGWPGTKTGLAAAAEAGEVGDGGTAPSAGFISGTPLGWAWATAMHAAMRAARAGAPTRRNKEFRFIRFAVIARRPKKDGRRASPAQGWQAYPPAPRPRRAPIARRWGPMPAA